MATIIDTRGWSWQGVARLRPDPPPFTRREWIATIPTKALLHPALPMVSQYGEAICPVCGRTLRDHEITILGQRYPRPEVCEGCHLAMTWDGWEDHRWSEMERLKGLGNLFDDDADDDDADTEEPCECCGQYCAPEEEDGLCPTCASQGCMGHSRPTPPPGPLPPMTSLMSVSVVGPTVTPPSMADSAAGAGTADATPPKIPFSVKPGDC